MRTAVIEKVHYDGPISIANLLSDSNVKYTLNHIFASFIDRVNDAGYIRNAETGEVITDRVDYENTGGRWFFPPPGPRDDKPWYLDWSMGGSFGNDGYKPSRGADYNPDNDLYTKTPSTQNYKYTDLNNFGDTALMGYRL